GAAAAPGGGLPGSTAGGRPPAAVKDARARARGDFLVLLNNDPVVPASWLDQRGALAQLAPPIGLVGPMSNQAAPPQLVEAIPYRLSPGRHRQPSAEGHAAAAHVDVTPVYPFAAQWRNEHRGAWMEVDRLGGCCLLVR